MKTCKKRWGALLLVLGMAVSSFTGTALAAEETTYPGEVVTTRVSTLSEDREQSFNEDWKFYLGTSSTAQNTGFNDSAWESVNLPHDFSIIQNFDVGEEGESGYLPGGTGWYRKTFTLPAGCEGKRIVINFDGVYANATVYVNGTQVGENHYGYTAFAFDITDYVTCDGTTENVIAVKAVNTIPSSRWYSGSGIYRDVSLIITDNIHVNYHGTYVTTPYIASGNGTVTVQTDVVNESGSDAWVIVRNTVYTKAGEQASDPAETSTAVGAGKTVTATSSPVVSSPKLWSTDEPNLYFVRTELLVDGTVVDTYDTTFGFRYVSFDSETGFYLNGKAVKLNGVCLHHDQGALGSAAYYDAMYRQLSIMKDMGANAIRTSHNPVDEDFIDICNELGLLVIEEAFDGWELPKNGNIHDFSEYFNVSLGNANVLGGESDMTWAEFALKSMIRRDRNQPCIILWSIGNEVQEGTSANSDFASIATKLIGWVKEVDTTRQTTIGSNRGDTSGTYGDLHWAVANGGGIPGFNYRSDWELENLHSIYGTIMSSETSSAVNSRGIYLSQTSSADVDGKYHLTSYDTSKVDWGDTAHGSLYRALTRDYVSGEFVWTGFDYIGEPTPWNGINTGSVSGAGAIPNSSYFGIVETTGFPKDTYYLYRSQWNQEATTLHLVTAWDSDNMCTTDGKTPVVIYSNAYKVELYCNNTLIGTAWRTVNQTSAGHQYYTYWAESNNSNICTAVSASGEESLYATFNVVYEAGTIYAKAYDENGNLITDLAGTTSVSTPGAVSRLDVTADKEGVLADGSSLVYITVDVEDASGVLDTTATNTIRFTLEGDGEIVGVDNGDQATTEKFQQSCVLESTTSAHIAAYAGKALVIVRSTKEAGSFTLRASSDGLAGASVTVQTSPTGNETAQNGLVSYSMVRDYTINVGTRPELQMSAAGLLANGTEITGTITWDAISETQYNTAGDYVINGVLYFEGQETVKVTCRLHVIADIIAVRNVSTATTPGTVPSLPDKVVGILRDGTLSGEFEVTWDNVRAERFAELGSIVTVNGTAAIIGETTLPVTASVRVTEAVITGSTNVAPMASKVTQDIDSGYWTDNLSSIYNNITRPANDTSERWSNWNNRYRSAAAALTFRWDTAQALNCVNLHYFYDYTCMFPESVTFEYSLNGQDFTPVGATQTWVDWYKVEDGVAIEEYTYTFNQVITPVALRITLKQQNGTTGNSCVALTEVEIMTYEGKIEYHGSAALSDIRVDGMTIAGFTADTYSYTSDGRTVTAFASANVGITILPECEGTVRILTISEDGNDARTYAVTVNTCDHLHTELRNVFAATCTEEGYTGDTYCLDCGRMIASGTVITATGHKPVLQNAREATCTDDGYTGDQVCTVCGVTVETGSVIPARGHSYNTGVVTKEPTETEEGVMTYTCTVCGEAKTASIPVLERVLTAPKAEISVTASNGRLVLTGKFADYENADYYYEVIGHGLVYALSSRVGTRALTVDTAGRVRVNFSGYKADGTFVYNLTPSSASMNYTVRAFLIYKDDKGRSIYVYSDAVKVNYASLLP